MKNALFILLATAFLGHAAPPDLGTASGAAAARNGANIVLPDFRNNLGFGTGVSTALATNPGSPGAVILYGGAAGTPSSITLTNADGTASGLTAGLVSSIGNLTGVVTSVNRTTSIADAALTIAKTSGLQTALDGKQATLTLGAGVSTALATNTGSAGSVILYGGAAGTPSSITLTNADGTASGLTAGLVSSIGSLTGDVTSSNRATTLATVNSNVGSFGSATKSLTATVNAKGLVTALSEQTVTPAIGSITGLGTGVGTFLATPSSANLASAITDETGTGAAVFGTSPTIDAPTISGVASFTSATRPTASSASGTPASTSLITRADGDARFAPVLLGVASTAQADATTTTPASITGMSSVALEANKWYRLEFAGRITNPSGSSFQVEMSTTQDLVITTGQLSGIYNNGSPSFTGHPLYNTTHRIILLQGNLVLTAGGAYSVMIFKTGSSAPTVSITFLQWTSPAGTSSLLSGATAIWQKLPM